MKYLIIFIAIASIFLLSCQRDQDSQDRCDWIPDAGDCEAIFPRFYYDKEDGKCKQFIWGGCDGVVPFETYADCASACGGDPCEPQGDCTLKPEAGLCNAAIPKYYFDNISLQCRMFIWGGCDGVVPFDTLEDCRSCECF